MAHKGSGPQRDVEDGPPNTSFVADRTKIRNNRGPACAIERSGPRGGLGAKRPGPRCLDVSPSPNSGPISLPPGNPIPSTAALQYLGGGGDFLRRRPQSINRSPDTKSFGWVKREKNPLPTNHATRKKGPTEAPRGGRALGS